MTPFLQFVIDVLSLGSAYALMALGLVIVYGILRLVNQAEVFPRPVVGLTEVALACGMIALLILRPGGIFATAEIGALLLAGRTRDRR